MKLTLLGHDDRYAVEQLQLALFPEGTEGEAVSSLQQTPFVPNRCPKCNAEINPNHAFCAVCGSKIGEFEDDDELKTIAISRSKPEPAGFCPNCKCEITENSAFCMKSD